MRHASPYRILLRKAGRNRIAIMVDSPWHAYDQTRFTISESGVQDIEEKNADSRHASKQTGSEW